MTQTLPAKVENYTALQAQASFTDAEKKAFRELENYIRTRTKDNILWYWDLGLKVKAVYDEAKKEGELYNKQVLLRLAKGLGFKTDRQLRNAMDVCRVWGTKKAFGEYLKMKGEAGNILSWSHIVYLSGIADADVRMQLAATSLDQCWTAEELWTKVKDIANRKPRGAGTRATTKVPTSARACLTHLLSQAQKFTYNVDNAWTGDAFSLRESVKDIPADKLDEKFVTALDKAQDEIVKMRLRAEQMEEMLNAVKADVQQRRDEQERLVADEAARQASEEAKTKVEKPKPKRGAKKKGVQRPGRVGV